MNSEDYVRIKAYLVFDGLLSDAIEVSRSHHSIRRLVLLQWRGGTAVKSQRRPVHEARARIALSAGGGGVTGLRLGLGVNLVNSLSLSVSLGLGGGRSGGSGGGGGGGGVGVVVVVVLADVLTSARDSSRLALL